MPCQSLTRMPSMDHPPSSRDQVSEMLSAGLQRRWVHTGHPHYNRLCPPKRSESCCLVFVACPKSHPVYSRQHLRLPPQLSYRKPAGIGATYHLGPEPPPFQVRPLPVAQLRHLLHNHVPPDHTATEP